MRLQNVTFGHCGIVNHKIVLVCVSLLCVSLLWRFSPQLASLISANILSSCNCSIGHSKPRLTGLTTEPSKAASV